MEKLRIDAQGETTEPCSMFDIDSVISEFIPGVMTVEHNDLYVPESIWADHPSVIKLQQTVSYITNLCKDEKILIEKDKIITGPVF